MVHILFCNSSPYEKKNNLKVHWIEKLPKLNYADKSVFLKAPNFDAANIFIIKII